MIRMFNVNVPENVAVRLDETLRSGYIAEGPRVRKFEQKLAPWLGTEHVAAVNSGTSALTLALAVADVGPGDVVVSTPMTCSATNLPVLTCGATLCWADIDPRTGLICPESVRQAARGARAVICVDWGGSPCELDELRHICDREGATLIEDAAHAFGATYKDRPVGSISDLTCFSWQAIKHLTTGDGGALTALDEKRYLRARRLRWFGIDRDLPVVEGTDSRIEQDIEEPGYKFHMNDLAATLGLAGLERVQKTLDTHRALAHVYEQSLPRNLVPCPGFGVSSRWLFTVLLPSPGMQKDFRNFMASRGVQVSQVHRRNDEYAAFARVARVPLPGVDDFAARQINLPIHAGMTAHDVLQVVRAAEEYFP